MKRAVTILILFITNGLYAQSPLAFSCLDLNPGPGDSDPICLIEYNGKVYFGASDGQHGRELWVSDGTVQGTRMVKDINPGAEGTHPWGFVVLNGMLYFTAYDTVHGKEFWVTDGTEAGTKLVKDINPGAGVHNHSSPSDKIVYGNYMIFTANGPEGREPWISDGTDTGTSLLKDIFPGGGSSHAGGYTLFNGKVYFSANDNHHSNDLWVTDGTIAGTKMLMDITMPTARIGTICVLGNRLYFIAESFAGGREIWVTDGTDTGTHEFTELGQAYRHGIDYNAEMIQVGNKMFFAAIDSLLGEELWVTDGSVAGTRLVKDIRPGKTGSNPFRFFAWDDKLFFSADDSVHGRELWVSDGTDSGTKMVKNIYPGGIGNSYIQPWIVYKHLLYFTAYTGTNDVRLFRTNGTEEGTFLVAPVVAPESAPLANIGYNFLRNDFFLVVDSTLFIAADYDSNGRELWAIRDTTVLPFKWMPDRDLPCGAPITVDAGNYDSYLWSTGDTVSGITITAPGMYWVEVKNIYGTFGDTFMISHKDTSTTPFVMPDVDMICSQPVLITTPREYDSYNWSTAETKESITVYEPGQYWVFVTNACGTYSDSFTVRHVDTTTVPIRIPDQLIDCDGEIQVQVPEYDTYQWSSGETTNKININSAGKYWVEVVNDCGTYSDTFDVAAIIDCVYVPSAFSPNKDGLNDWFRPRGIKDATGYEFAVFNRWGQPVFSSRNLNEGWNGMHKASNSEMGVYYWYLKYHEGGAVKEKKGSVVLLR
jgi:gliding motility-associated-like protein